MDEIAALLAGYHASAEDLRDARSAPAADLAAAVLIPGNRHFGDVEQLDPVRRRPAPPAVSASEVWAHIFAADGAAVKQIHAIGT